MDNHQPRVSLGMPVYNGESFLCEAIDSILAQTFTDFELIISDNASTDKTPEICQAYVAQDPRIHYYRNDHNLGGASNQSRVAELASGQYFKWVHHDDICAPEFLERCVEVLDQHPSVVLCYPKTIVINEHGEQIKKYNDDFDLRFPFPHKRFQRYHQLVRYGHECNPFHGLIRTQILQKTPLVAPYPSSDLVLLGELTLYGEFYEIPEELFFKRDHPNTSVRANPTYKQRLAWYDPSKKGTLQLTKWKWFFEYLKAIKQVPMSGYEKARCYQIMVQWMTWNWVFLGKDLLKAATWPFLKPFLSFESQKSIEKTIQLTH